METFSYAYGTPKPLSDEYEAAKLAAFCGYAHRIALDGSVSRRSNAPRGWRC